MFFYKIMILCVVINLCKWLLFSQSNYSKFRKLIKSEILLQKRDYDIRILVIFFYLFIN